MKKSGNIVLSSGTFGLLYGISSQYLDNNDIFEYEISRCQNGIWEFEIEKKINKSLFITGFWEGKRNYREYYNKYDNWKKFEEYEMYNGILLYDIKRRKYIDKTFKAYKNKFGFFDHEIFVSIDFENAFLENIYVYTDEDDVIHGFDIMIKRERYE